VRQGRLRSTWKRGTILLAKAELEQALKVVEARRKLRHERQQLQRSGKSTEAARKAIYRKRGAAPKIGYG
jgi:hypothetical protein